VILELLLTAVVIAGLLRVANYLLSDFRLMTQPQLPPMHAWELKTDYCHRPMARALDSETLEPVGGWRPMPKFTGMMRVQNGVLYARDWWDSSIMED